MAARVPWQLSFRGKSLLSRCWTQAFNRAVCENCASLDFIAIRFNFSVWRDHLVLYRICGGLIEKILSARIKRMCSIFWCKKFFKRDLRAGRNNSSMSCTCVLFTYWLIKSPVVYIRTADSLSNSIACT